MWTLPLYLHLNQKSDDDDDDDDDGGDDDDDDDMVHMSKSIFLKKAASLMTKEGIDHTVWNTQASLSLL